MEQIIQDMIIKHAEKIDFFLIGKTILEIVIFYFVMKFVNKTLHVFFNKLLDKVTDNESKKNYYTLRQLGIYVIDAIIILFFVTNILANFGIDTKAILATAGVLGVAVGFGGKKIVEDVFTGLSIILTGQLRVGDYVTVNSSTGTVEKLTLTMCVIRAFNGDVHYLRNGQIDTVINQTKDFSYPLFNLGVAYKTDVTHVMRVLKELGKELKESQEFGKYILSDIEVFGLNEFQDSAIVIQFRIKTTPQEQWAVKRKLNQMIKERFEQEGIEIPYPQLVINKSEGEV